MADITYEDHQDLARKLSLANDRVAERDDRIARLQRELENVKAERDRQYDENVSRIAAEGAAILRAEAAESRLSDMQKELERLREVLTVVEERLSQIDCASIGMMHNTSQSELLDWCKGIASAGLSKIYAARRLVEGDGK